MKRLLLLLPIICLGQSFSPMDLPWLSGKGATVISQWNGKPEGLGNMYLHWIYTNLPNPSVNSHGTNWVDLIQQAPLNWNRLLTEPINTTTGILSTAASGVRDALTNCTSLVTNLGTNFSAFIVFRQINNAFGANTMPIVTDTNSSGQYLAANGGAGTDLSVSYAGTSATYVKSANNIPIDVYLTWSNGVFWAWTNGIIAINAQTFNNSGTPWNTGLSLFSAPNSTMAVWHGTIAELGFYTNLPLTTSSQVVNQFGSVSNLHWYVTNTPVLKTNGVNCIFP